MIEISVDSWSAIEKAAGCKFSGVDRNKITGCLDRFDSRDPVAPLMNKRKALKEKLRRWLKSQSPKRNLEIIKRDLGVAYEVLGEYLKISDEYREMGFWLSLAIDTVELKGGDTANKEQICHSLSKIRYRNNEQVEFVNKKALLSGLLNVWKTSTNNSRILLAMYTSEFNLDYCESSESVTRYVNTPANEYLSECLILIGIELQTIENQLRLVVESINRTASLFAYLQEAKVYK
ncbi:hypothetical protein GP2143_03193 [marine gamma proteobacterium HTCC2143]|uniref:Uncharacterized protein n=1 Tax=marine gamma proteobacterium HTCC2143 TaxID=247633 RepID=A0YCZ0_9GAMM|nr:hypothetical protein GP2143_03193 [marine gamma proteobacterium HTCC2143]